MTLKIPNTEGRRRAVRIHDLHHVVTGYQTDLRGEAEIGAWELASGCLRWPAATVLNLFALAIGLVIAPAAACPRVGARPPHAEPLPRERRRASAAAQGRRDARRPRPRPAAPRARVRDVLAVVALALPMLAMMAAPLLVVLAVLHAVL